MHWRILAVIAVLGIGSAFGQAPLRFEVPFDFTAGTEHLKAGTYEVTLANQSTPIIRSVEKKSAIFVMAPATASGKYTDTGKLVFNRYGDSYFLSQIWGAGRDRGHVLNKSGLEKEIASRMASQTVAMVTPVGR
jgi:hypothetical protein